MPNLTVTAPRLRLFGLIDQGKVRVYNWTAGVWFCAADGSNVTPQLRTFGEHGLAAWDMPPRNDYGPVWLTAAGQMWQAAAQERAAAR